MMNAQTVNQFSIRMVGEPDSINYEPTHLTHEELALFTALRQGEYGLKRLEQERLSSEYITQALKEWLYKTIPYSV